MYVGTAGRSRIIRCSRTADGDFAGLHEGSLWHAEVAQAGETTPFAEFVDDRNGVIGLHRRAEVGQGLGHNGCVEPHRLWKAQGVEAAMGKPSEPAQCLRHGMADGQTGSGERFASLGRALEEPASMSEIVRVGQDIGERSSNGRGAGESRGGALLCPRPRVLCLYTMRHSVQRRPPSDVQTEIDCESSLVQDAHRMSVSAAELASRRPVPHAVVGRPLGTGIGRRHADQGNAEPLGDGLACIDGASPTDCYDQIRPPARCEPDRGVHTLDVGVRLGADEDPVIGHPEIALRPPWCRDHNRRSRALLVKHRCEMGETPANVHAKRLMLETERDHKSHRAGVNFSQWSA